MTLQHLGIACMDRAAMTTFLKEGFGMQAVHENSRITMLADGNGFQLALAAHDGPVSWPPDFHIGFYVSEIDLREVYIRLGELGWERSEPAITFGAERFFVRGPEGVLFEVKVA
jgi:catechol 2,3-dioxygenase-like lactoylglutathione lyase family enzyme